MVVGMFVILEETCQFLREMVSPPKKKGKRPLQLPPPIIAS